MTTSTTQVPDVTNLLVQLEGVHEAAGWQEMPPTVYRVDYVADMPIDAATGMRADLYHAQPFTLHGELGDSITEELGVLVTNTQSRMHLLWSLLIAPTPPVAHLFVTYAWVNTRPVNLAALRKDQGLADVLGSQEARFAYGVIGERTVSFYRIRGHELVRLSGTATQMTATTDRMAGMIRCLHDGTVASYTGGE